MLPWNQPFPALPSGNTNSTGFTSRLQFDLSLYSNGRRLLGLGIEMANGMTGTGDGSEGDVIKRTRSIFTICSCVVFEMVIAIVEIP